jgi:isopentenyl-diphosphate delta-isomerase
MIRLSKETQKRKADHIRISLDRDVQARGATTGFEDVHFIHRALPEIDRDEIDLSTTAFNHRFKAPIIIGAITGGTDEAAKINATIAEVVEEFGIGMGVGSQRAAMEDSKLEKTFAIVRKKAPDAFLIANIGAVQLVNGFGLKQVEKAIQMINADAVAFHLNSLQEAVQPEGQTNFRGILSKISEIADELDKPVIAKETGAGIAAEEAMKLEKAGVEGIDVSGVGGTSFAAVEHYRRKWSPNPSTDSLGEVFWDWGIPTATSIVEVSRSTKLEVIGSGGVRSGIDVAKAIALGSRLASSSQPVLRAAVKGSRETSKLISRVMDELRNAMFLAGAKSVNDLHKEPLIIMGKTAERLSLRGFDVSSYALRGRK